MTEYRMKSRHVTAHRMPALEDLGSDDAATQESARARLGDILTCYQGVVRAGDDAVDGACVFLNSFHMELKARPGEWIVQRVTGGIEVMSDAVFQNLYEAV